MKNLITKLWYKNRAMGKPILKSTLMKKLSVTVLMVATLMIMTVPIAANDAFAVHLSEELKWQLVFISTNSCGNFNYETMNKYDQIAEKYLEMYQLDNTKYKPTCVSESKYNSDYKAPLDLDLIIFVYDKELGEKELHSQKMSGLYAHSGVEKTHNHSIIFCGDCSNFYYSDPVWILSHELSHFVLNFRNYDLTIYEDFIHENDEYYDQCIENNLNCKSAVTKLEIPSSTHLYSVMPIYEPALEEFIQDAMGDEVLPIVRDLGKLITNWWAAGKISDGDYANAVGYVVEHNFEGLNNNVETFLADGPIDDTITWQDKFSELYSNSDTKTDNNDILSRLPNNLVSEEQRIFSEQTTLGMPEWFKTTAIWWAEDKITNKEFKKSVGYLVETGIIRPHASKVLEGVIFEEDTLVGNSLQVLLDDVEYVTGSENSEVSKILSSKLEAAKKQFDNNKSAKACKNLDKFIERVSVYIDESKLDEASGQKLINSADIINLNFC